MRQETSNRHTYEKLEPELTPLLSMKVLALIDSQTHFIQGTAPTSPVLLALNMPALADEAEGALATTIKMATRKLEFLLSARLSITSKFLIDNFERLFSSHSLFRGAFA